MAHRVSSRADEELRNEFRLSDWVRRHKTRREVYFQWCDRAARELTLLAGRSPTDESLVIALIAAISNDDSFASHVRRRRRAAFLTENGNWDKLYRAGATTILEEYFDEVENGTWP